MGRERRRRKGERKWEKGQWGEGKGEKKREKEDGRLSSGYKLSHPPSESERELSRSESGVATIVLACVCEEIGEVPFFS